MLEITLTLFASVIIIWFWWRKRKLSLFKRMNIPGPTPGFFFGNSSEIARKGENRCYKEWMDKYGKVFGCYHGLRPTLVVADLDMINTIMIQNSHQYTNKPTIKGIGTVSDDYAKHSLFLVNGKQWKRLRRLVTPLFSSLKLKMVMPIMEQTVDELIDAVERKSSKQSFNIHELYRKLTTDTIARSSLGIHSRAQVDSDDPVFKLIPFIAVETHLFLKILAFAFPELWWGLSVIWQIITKCRPTEQNRNHLEQLIGAAVQARVENPKDRRKDLLQLLIDAGRAEKFENNKDLKTDKESDKNTSKDDEKLSKIEIVQNAITVLFAGYETTALALGCATHLLAHHQDIQDEVREEIRSIVSENKEISYEAIQNMSRLENVIAETLRIYPPAPSVIVRQGTKNMKIEGNIIPKQAVIHVPVQIIHHDPELWKYPERFNPHRWSSEENSKHHPMIFQAFGVGPRNCPGKRFAYIEIKLALAKLLQKYKILPPPHTKQEHLQFNKRSGIVMPKNGIIVEVQKISIPFM